MRPLSSTLLQAQKDPSTVPYVKVEVLDRVGGIARLRFQRHYTGTEVDFFHGATMPSDGSLIRARIDSSAGYKLYVQRVVSPSPTSDFGAWGLVTSVSNSGDVAICSEGTRVLLFYVATNQQTLYVRESNNSGQTFGAPVIVATAASPVTWMAADVKADGTALLLYLIGAASLYAVKRSGGSWGAPVLWSNSLSSINGMALTYDLDWNVLIAGKDTPDNKPGVWTAIYGDGNAQTTDTWSALRNLTIAEEGSGITFLSPFMEKPGPFRAMFTEKYTGTPSYKTPFFTYTMPSASYADNLWREPAPFELTCSYGVALAYKTSQVWLSTPYGVWSASLDPAPLDLNGDVLRVTASVSPTWGECEIELRNDDGRYLNLGSGSLELLQKGSEVRVSPGFVTSSGQEASSGPTYWIQGFEHRRDNGRSTFLIHAIVAWGLFQQWKARRQFAWDAGDKNVSDLIAFVLARAGVDFQPGATSSTMTAHYPAFTIHPGETDDTALKRLLQTVQDVLTFSQGVCSSINPLATDPSTYSYGTDHTILKGHYRDPAPDFNRVQVFGAGTFSESYDWTEIPNVYDRLRQVHDANLDTSQKASDRASKEMRHQALGHQKGSIVVPVNAGQELYDVIDITDAAAGLSGAKRRVMAIRTEYSVTGQRPRYLQTLYLGGV